MWRCNKSARGTRLNSYNTIAFILLFYRNCLPESLYGESMAEDQNEDQIAMYRLKLEQTADLVARIRHEINNPLTGVLGQAQLLLREELSERSRKRVQTIEDLAIRLRDIVAQLREVQRPSSDGDNETKSG